MSRELDAEVAEKVMGYEWWTFLNRSCLMLPREVEANCWRGSSWEKGKTAEADIDGCTFTYGGSLDSKGHGKFWIPEYSTKIAAAFQVVEKMREKGYEFDLCTATANAGWVADFFTMTSENYIWQAIDKTIPMAIVKSALHATGERGSR